MTDNVVTFPGSIKASTPTKEAYPLTDMVECFTAMHDMLVDPAYRVEGVAISLVVRADGEQATYSAYCSNNVAAQLGGLLMLQKRIMEDAT